MIAYLIDRLRRVFMVAFVLSSAAAGCGIAEPASAQDQIRTNITGIDGRVAVCIEGPYLVVAPSDDCDDNDPSTIIRRLDFGPDATKTTLAGDGSATFGNNVSFNSTTNFNGGVSFNSSVTFSNSLTTNGISNTGSISTGSLTTSSDATIGGALTVTGNMSAKSLVLTNGLLVDGGSQLRGTTSITGALVISSGTTINMGGNRVQNVGTPTTATDAANKAYVDAVAGNGAQAGTSAAAAFGGGSTYDPATGTITAPSYTVGTTAYNNVGAALNAANTTGLANFHSNSTLPDGAATGANSIAVGSSRASGANSVAIGQSTASGANSFAAGNGATASASGAVAVGNGAAATGVNAVAIGNGAKASGSVAVGVAATAANGGAAFGDRAVATGVNSTALGPDASATADNAVAIGSGSTATVANTVSVGTATNQRRLVNVAAGTAASDAATVGQLQAGGASTAAALGGGSAVRADGMISAPSYSIAGTTYNNVGSALSGVVALSYDIRNEARRGIAATTAMGVAPMPSEPGRTSWVANTAIFRGEIGYGASIAHRFDTKTPLALTAGIAYARGGNTIGRVGMAGEF